MHLQFSNFFNFDEWMVLAKKNPEEFEKRRTEIINLVIENAPTHLHKRLRGLQWRIDVIRNQSKNPLAGCIAISTMMWDFIYSDRGFPLILELLAGKKSVPRVKAQSENVLSLSKNNQKLQIN